MLVASPEIVAEGLLSKSEKLPVLATLCNVMFPVNDSAEEGIPCPVELTDNEPTVVAGVEAQVPSFLKN
ncbi:MAG: hypothetical protein J6T34_03950 [Bacilli bacterium]|nr:hypothetical protein [Bacilli bacterium]